MDQPPHSLAIPGSPRRTRLRPPSNLLPALLLLPRGRRRDALLFAAWCRGVDDVADDPALPVAVRRERLSAWVSALAPGGEERLPEDFRDLILRRDLDRTLLREILLGMLMDVPEGGRVRFATFPDLELYCRRVASAVGLLSARIFGAGGEGVGEYAILLGIALQLTNILRDVAEDALMDRIYIPLEDLERFGVSEADILSGNVSPAMIHLLSHQADRADSWFAKAETAWENLSVNQRRLMRPARLMSAIYRELLLSMHRERHDIFAKRYMVSPARRLVLVLSVLME